MYRVCAIYFRYAAVNNEDPDKILDDPKLRAMRRALLIADLKHHPERILRNWRHSRLQRKVRDLGEQDTGSGLLDIHTKTPLARPSRSVGQDSPPENDAADLREALNREYLFKFFESSLVDSALFRVSI